MLVGCSWDDYTLFEKILGLVVAGGALLFSFVIGLFLGGEWQRDKLKRAGWLSPDEQPQQARWLKFWSRVKRDQ
ncbi:MAG: hypothetical protein LC776_04530 [Acidobacteria bacterium]|nr:hypothetical protein [Acidobacteriota bacterium]